MILKIKILSILLIIVAAVLLIDGVKPENNNLPNGFFTPIIAFEFATNNSTIQHFFEVKDVQTYEQKMLRGNWIDYIFMAIYSLLLFSISLFFYKIKKQKTLIIAMVLCFVMWLMDGLENWQIYNIITSYKTQNVQYYINWMQLFTWIKWSSIIAVFMIWLPILWKGNWFAKIFSAVIFCCFVFCIIAYFIPPIYTEIFTTLIVLCFLFSVIFSFYTKAIQEN